MLLWLAIVPTSIVCALIVAKRATQHPSPAIDLSAYLNPPSASPGLTPPSQPKLNASFTDSTMPFAKDVQPSTHPAAQMPKAEMTAQLAKEKVAFSDAEIRVTPGPPVEQGNFSFQEIPFDAPVAEFPLVLVWQKQLELDTIREMDNSLSPPETDPLSELRNNVYRVPVQPPGPGPKPPVESNSGL